MLPCCGGRPKPSFLKPPPMIGYLFLLRRVHGQSFATSRLPLFGCSGGSLAAPCKQENGVKMILFCFNLTFGSLPLFSLFVSEQPLEVVSLCLPGTAHSLISRIFQLPNKVPETGPNDGRALGSAGTNCQSLDPCVGENE